MTPEVTAGFAICFIMIAGLSVWVWRLNVRIAKLTKVLDSVTRLTKENTVFLDGVKATAASMKEHSQRRIAELQTRTPR
jgi:hypothetical protein